MVWAALLAMLALVGTASAAPKDYPAQEALDTLNRIRAENGIPAGITLNDDWSAKCAAHDRYMQQNDVVTHPEDPNKPGYSDGGNWAGTHSVLAGGGEWGGDSTPWDTAPIHLAQMLGPGLVETGIANVGVYSCMTTWPGYERVGPADVIYTYPGDGRTDVDASERAAESPFIPGDFVGLPSGTTTGPYLYVLPDGPWISDRSSKPRITAASLSGPAGLVDVRTIDNTNPNLAGYLPTGSGMVIPVNPLRDNATYTATVTLSGGGDTLTKTWSFGTAALANTVVLSLAGINRVRVRSDDPKVTVTATNVATAAGHTFAAKMNGGSAVVNLGRLPLGVYTVCASSGGDSTEYEAAKACRQSVKVMRAVQAAAYVTISRIAVMRGIATIVVRASGPLLGARVVLASDSGYLCGTSWCGGWDIRTRRSLILRSEKRLAVKAPPRNGWVEFKLTVKTFVKNDVYYVGFAVTRSKSLPP